MFELPHGERLGGENMGLFWFLAAACDKAGRG